MVIAVASYSLRDHFRDGRITAESYPQFCREKFDITALEYNDMFIKDDSPAGLEAIRKAIEAAGATADFMAIGGNLVGGSPEERKEEIEKVRGWLKAAHTLGMPAVRINLGRTGDEERDRTEGVELGAQALNELLPTLQQLNIRSTIENHGGPSKWADTVVRVIEKTDRDWIGACPDFGNFGHGEDAYESLAMLAPYAFHVHAKTHNFTPDGEEQDLDYGRILGIYKRAGYDGLLSIEYEGKEDQVEGVLKTRDLIRKHW